MNKEKTEGSYLTIDVLLSLEKKTEQVTTKKNKSGTHLSGGFIDDFVT